MRRRIVVLEGGVGGRGGGGTGQEHGWLVDGREEGSSHQAGASKLDGSLRGAEPFYGGF